MKRTNRDQSHRVRSRGTGDGGDGVHGVRWMLREVDKVPGAGGCVVHPGQHPQQLPAGQVDLQANKRPSKLNSPLVQV
eukprot:7633066-Pyramimonas_sp.AAC.1